jgi:hypothetical protein
MKITITITTLILAVAATLGWRQWNALQQLRAVEHALASKAANPTTVTKPGSDSHAPGTRMSRTEREAEARTTAAKLIASLNEAGKQIPGDPYQEMEKRVKIVLAQMDQMNGVQLRVMIEDFRTSTDMEDPWFLRKEAIGVAIDALADTDPASAMALLTDKGGQLNDLMFEGYDRVIGKWASTDPLAALAWVRENRAKINKHEGLRAFVIGLAAKDPKLAMQSLVEFGTYEIHGDGEYEGNPNFSVAQQIARTARTLEDRTAMLGILRELADSPGDDPDNIKGLIVENALHAMAEGLSTYDSARTTAWLESLDLRPGEAAHLMRVLPNSEINATGEAGKWQRENQQAVEKWLTQAADGPARRTAASTSATNAASRQAEPEQHPEPTPGPYPVAGTVDGRPGFVASPYNGKIIDVRGVSSGTLVADPSCPAAEKKYFRVP